MTPARKSRLGGVRDGQVSGFIWTRSLPSPVVGTAESPNGREVFPRRVSTWIGENER